MTVGVAKPWVTATARAGRAAADRGDREWCKPGSTRRGTRRGRARRVRSGRRDARLGAPRPRRPDRAGVSSSSWSRRCTRPVRRVPSRTRSRPRGGPVVPTTPAPRPGAGWLSSARSPRSWRGSRFRSTGVDGRRWARRTTLRGDPRTRCHGGSVIRSRPPRRTSGARSTRDVTPPATRRTRAAVPEPEASQWSRSPTTRSSDMADGHHGSTPAAWTAVTALPDRVLRRRRRPHGGQLGRLLGRHGPDPRLRASSARSCRRWGSGRMTCSPAMDVSC